MTEPIKTFSRIVGRIMCWSGFHDYRVTDVNYGFSYGETVEKVQCKRCGQRMARMAK